MSAPISEGEVLAGKYRIERILGRGGMGVVVQATHLQLGQRVAIKFLHERAKAENVERFLREARASVRLKSEHVARVLDVGELDNGAPYMVMEYLTGNDLSQVLKKRGQLPIAEAVGYVLDACEAIAEAHASGIIHRDLKPANLFLTTAADGSHMVKVLDFGISKATDTTADPQMALTETAALLGSPLYMAPEQMRSARSVDARADIWSLGAITYQLITGQTPFSADTYAELILTVNTEPPTPLSHWRSDVPPELEAAILRCLEKKPADRCPSVAELAWALAPFGPPEAHAAADRIARTLGASRSRSSYANAPSIPPPTLPSIPPAAATAQNSTAAGAWIGGGTDSNPKARAPKAILFATFGALAILGGVIAAFVFKRPAPAQTTPLSAPEAPASTAAPLPPPPSTSEPLVAPAPQEPQETSATPVTSALPPSPPPQKTKTAAATATPTAVATPPAPPRAETPPPPQEKPKPKNPLEMELKE